MIRRFLLVCTLAILPHSAWCKSTTENAFSPRHGATALVIKTLDTAQETICLAAHSFTSRPIANALILAQERGVDVRVVLDRSQEKARRSLYKLLLDSGVPTRINHRYAIMHNKFAVVDNSTLELGSFNYTKAAEEKNAENVLVIRKNKKLIASYSQQCDKL